MGKTDEASRLRTLLDRQNVLLAVTRAVCTDLDRDALTAAIGEALQPILQFDQGLMIMLPSPTGAGFEVYGTYDLNRGTLKARDTVSGARLVPEHLQNGRILHFSSHADLAAKGGDIEVPKMLGIHSGMVIPLLGSDGPLGALAVGSSRNGSFDHIDLSFAAEIADVVAAALSNTLAYEENRRLKDQLAAENRYLRDSLGAAGELLLGTSDAMAAVRRQIASVAGSDTTVLIVGETGTGKELVANEIHRLSRRADRILVKVNCAALSGGLAESELFGHVRGAFTDARADRRGRFELADGATLLLDEVAELPFPVQATLLRALQQGEIERVGADEVSKVDVRVIAATSRDLPKMIAEGTFRQDLYYRLNVFAIGVPPLRERRADIPELITHFLAQCARKFGKTLERMADEALTELCQRDWSGNVRELQNVVERAAILAKGPVVDLRSPIAQTGRHELEPTSNHLSDVEKTHIQVVLGRTGWLIGGAQGAAEQLGLNPSTLRSRMRKLGITRPPAETAEGDD